ncbi:MAG: SDR family oxidoreductase [Luminiphilus sp.]|nr:SDR family oxidoreductase [Luminiphilus sp.]
MGIAGRRALVCASSKGLGRGCAEALAAEGVDLVLNARSADTLEVTAEEIRAVHGVKVTTVPADVTTDQGRAAILEQAGDLDIVVNNAGGPPPGSWRDWDRDAFIAAFDANAYAAIALMQATVPAMCDRGWGRVVNITSVSVKQPIGVLGLSNTARAALTGFVAGIARDVADQGVVINNLLPGLHATDRTVGLDTYESSLTGEGVADVSARRQTTIPARRYGSTSEFGATCAFMCSVQAGFMIGQNILLDGGAFNSTL